MSPKARISPESAPVVNNGNGATELLRRHAEDQFAAELDELARADTETATAAMAALALGGGDVPDRRYA